MSEDGEHERLTGNAGGDPAPSADQRGDGPGEQPDWDVPKRIVAFAGACVLTGAGLWLVQYGIDPAGSFGLGLVALVGASVLVGGAFVLIAVGIVGTPTPVGPAGARELQAMTAYRGQPADPKAYQGGGLAIAAKAYTLEEAELLASLLRGADIPAWVEGEYMAAWNWHYQLGLHPGGIRVLVPRARLDAAAATFDRLRREGREFASAEPDDAAQIDNGYPLLRAAQRLGYLLLIGILSPVVFVLSLRLLARIRRLRQAGDTTPSLIKARRLALFIAVLASPALMLFFGLMGWVTLERTVF